MPAHPSTPAARQADPLWHLPGQRLFASHDLDEVRVQVGGVMKPHRLDVKGRSQRLNARMHHFSLGGVGLSRLSYGADVAISPGPLRDFYLIQMPLCGQAAIRHGAQQLDSTPEFASVLNPTDTLDMRWGADNDSLMVRIARPLLEGVLAAQLGSAERPLAEPLRFKLGFAWQACVPWRGLMSYLLECAAQDPALPRHALVAAQFEQMVITTLLSLHAHNYQGQSPARATPVLPRHVRRVQDYLHTHAHEPIRAEQLAALAGVSLRSLYAGFKDFAGVSPMQYLKEIRLQKAHAELQHGGGSVASIALRWGFAHFGRFSADYKARFGCSPRESLKSG